MILLLTLNIKRVIISYKIKKEGNYNDNNRLNYY